MLRTPALMGLALVLPALVATPTHADPAVCVGQNLQPDPKAIGSGTLADPYRLCNTYQIRNLGNAPADWGHVYALEQSFTVSSFLLSGFKPIGTMAVPFTGTFLGQGYTITGFAWTGASTDYVGLFGVVAGHVEGLRMTNPNLTGKTNVGVVAGALIAGGAITDVHVRGGALKAGAGNGGGLVGRASGGVITRSSVSGTTVTTTLINGGGLVGYLYGGGAVVDSWARATVDTRGPNSGGLVGNATGATITSSWAAGVVKGTSAFSGGFVGGCGLGTTISDAFAAATVSGNHAASPSTVGLFAGSKACVVDNAYHDSDQACTNAGGTGCASAMPGLGDVPGTLFPDYFYTSGNEPLASWDFVDTWVERTGDYPNLVGAP